jgi:hypothetical protein
MKHKYPGIWGKLQMWPAAIGIIVKLQGQGHGKKL